MQNTRVTVPLVLFVFESMPGKTTPASVHACVDEGKFCRTPQKAFVPESNCAHPPVATGNDWSVVGLEHAGTPFSGGGLFVLIAPRQTKKCDAPALIGTCDLSIVKVTVKVAWPATPLTTSIRPPVVMSEKFCGVPGGGAHRLAGVEFVSRLSATVTARDEPVVKSAAVTVELPLPLRFEPWALHEFPVHFLIWLATVNALLTALVTGTELLRLAVAWTV